MYIKKHRLSPSETDSLSCISPLVEHIFNLWQFRNAQRHSVALAQQQTELHRQAQNQISELYQYKHSVLPNDCQVFHPSLNDHLQEPLTRLQAWLHNHAPYILESYNQAQKMNASNTRPLTHYFSTLT